MNMRASKILTATLMLCMVFSVSFSSTAFAAEAVAPAPAATQLSLTPGSTATGVNLTWYSDDSAANNQSQARFMTNGKTAVTGKGTVSAASAGKLSHKVSITGLKENTAYTYQVSSNGTDWSSA